MDSASRFVAATLDVPRRESCQESFWSSSESARRVLPVRVLERHRIAIDAQPDESMRPSARCRLPTSRLRGAVVDASARSPDGEPTKPFVEAFPGRRPRRRPRRGDRARADRPVLAAARQARAPRPEHCRGLPCLLAARRLQGGHRPPHRPLFAFHRDAGSRAGSRLPAEVPPLLARDPAVQRAHPHPAPQGRPAARHSREARHVRRGPARRRPRRRGDRRPRRPDDARVLRARRRRRDGRARRSRGDEAARSDRPEEVLPHGRQLPRARGGVEAGGVDARDRALDRLLPERGRDRRAGRARRVPRAPDGGARLRARARGRDLEAGQVVLARGGGATTSAATSSSTTSRRATSSGARCARACSRSARRSTRSARSGPGS